MKILDTRTYLETRSQKANITFRVYVGLNLSIFIFTGFTQSFKLKLKEHRVTGMGRNKKENKNGIGKRHEFFGWLGRSQRTKITQKIQMGKSSKSETPQNKPKDDSIKVINIPDSSG